MILLVAFDMLGYQLSYLGSSPNTLQNVAGTVRSPQPTQLVCDGLLWMGRLNGREGTDHMTPFAEAKKDEVAKTFRTGLKNDLFVIFFLFPDILTHVPFYLLRRVGYTLWHLFTC